MLARMRRGDDMCAGTEGIDAIKREDADYWLDIATRRRCPGQVLLALRVLPTELAHNGQCSLTVLLEAEFVLSPSRSALGLIGQLDAVHFGTLELSI